MQIIHPQLIKSLSLARKHLVGVRDPVGSSVLEHGIRVYSRINLALSSKSSSSQQEIDILSASLLHDVLEDSKCTEKEILKNVNNVVLDLVKELTITFENKSIEEAVSSLKHVSSNAYLIKMADISDNTKKAHLFVYTNYPSWYHSFYFPLLRQYSNISLLQLKRMKKDNYQYLNLAIKLHDEVTYFSKTLKKLVYDWEILMNDLPPDLV